MAPSSLHTTLLDSRPELHLTPSPTESEVEDGFYQPIPRPSWYSRLFKTTTFMPLHQRHHLYSPHTYAPEGRSSTSSISKHRDDFTSLTPLPPKRSNALWILKTACLLIPIVVLCLLGILHVLQYIIGGVALIVETEESFLPDWGQPGHFGEGLAHYPTDATRDVLPIPVHSHNDYWRRIPLFDALHYGCTGVEADVWLFDDDLYVGHNTASLTLNQTFRSLYVDPLIELLDKQNPQTEFVNASHHGVFDQDPDQTLVLLVDLKTDGRSTFPVVMKQLEGLRSRGYLTYFNGTHTVPGAITVVGTGNTPFDMVLANSEYRDIFYDAPLERLSISPRPPFGSDILVDTATDTALNHGPALPSPPAFQAEPPLHLAGQGKAGISQDTPSSAFNVTTSYYASINFKKAVGFVWRGHLSQKQIDILRGQIQGAKKNGLKARYWNTPAWPISLRNHIWHVLVKEGADMLNADDLRSAATEDWRRWKHEWW